MTKFADHDAYIAAAPEEFRPLLAQLRTQLAKVLPDAEEIIAYDMPGFGFGNSVIAGYAAFTKQCGLYLSNGAISAHADDIAAAGSAVLISNYENPPFLSEEIDLRPFEAIVWHMKQKA